MADKSPPPEAPGPDSVLQGQGRLSDSVIWSLQRAFYEAEGPSAWKPKGIPFWMTSNTFFARALARVALAFMRDLATARPSALDRDAPLYMLELASGSGQFAYLFLKRLQELKKTVPGLEGLDVRLVMTDFTDSNVNVWRAHERFRPFVAQGMLDFARFDLERDHELHLLESGERISAAGLRNPLVVLANYAFDSTLQDVFKVDHETISQDLVTTMVTAEGAAEPGDPHFLERIRLRFEALPMAAAYYDDPISNRVLEGYRSSLGDTTFLFPVGALRCLRRLLDLSGDRLFLLCGDKGVAHEEKLRHLGDPIMTLHGGCFSFSVNLHAIGMYFREAGGVALHATQHAPDFQVSGFVCGFEEAALTETRQAFQDQIDDFGPAEFFTLVKSLCDTYESPPLELLVAILKLCDGDAEVVYVFRDLLVKRAREATPVQRQDLRRLMARAWDGFYPLHKDLAFQLARISIAMSEPGDALRYCEASLRVFGDSHLTELMMAYSHCMQGRNADGLRCAERALALQADYAPALELKARLQSML
jgi:hypothetical protein